MIHCVPLICLVWNKELLYVGGFLCRTAYDLELSSIDSLWAGAAKSNQTLDFRPNADVENWLRQRFLHVLKFFTFRTSTPSAEVARSLEVAFYECSTHPLKLLSSIGVRAASDIKESDPVFSQFLKHLPVLPDSAMQECAPTVGALQSRGMILAITFNDVLSELREHPLNEDELVACLKWWIDLPSSSTGVHTAPIRTELLNAAILCPRNSGGNVLPLSSLRYFINTRSLGTHIPLDGPLPASLMPVDVTKHFTPPQLVAFGWSELTVVDWLQHIIKPDVVANDPPHDVTKSVEWAERVLTILARVWSSLSNEAHDTVKKALTGKTCIPTTRGLQAPEGSYFPTVKIFSDLPVVSFSSGMQIKGSIDKLLFFIGVRRHVNLQLVFDR